MSSLTSIDDFCSIKDREKAKFVSIHEDTIQEMGVPVGAGQGQVEIQRTSSWQRNAVSFWLCWGPGSGKTKGFIALEFQELQRKLPNVPSFRAWLKTMGLHFDLHQLKNDLIHMYSLEVMIPGTAQDPLALLSHPVDVGNVSCCRGYWCCGLSLASLSLLKGLQLLNPFNSLSSFFVDVFIESDGCGEGPAVVLTVRQ